MGKFLLYLAIAFIIWRIVVTLSRKGSAPTTQVRGAPPPEERVAPRRGPEIDYSRVRDAEYREIESRRIEREHGERPRDPDGRIDPGAG
ncbi:MAG TPA: hypothetical protein VNA88_06665 [Candidatus Kapabacteria bacterium]|jgi:hypothetical protein|nr:hypothetical protein [Candidatus Kapabacteria bacterium]